MKEYSCRRFPNTPDVVKAHEMFGKHDPPKESEINTRYYCSWCGLTIKRNIDGVEEEHIPGWIKDL